MNFEKLESTLPNGLHDSRLKSISIDYIARTILLGLDIFTGDPDAKDKKDRESYRPAEIQILKFDFCVIDPPANGYPFDKATPVTIDAGAGQPSTAPANLPKHNGFLFWIWANEWNSFIRIAAHDIQLQWK